MADSARSAPFTADATTAVVRYQVLDMERAITFYTERLGFRLARQAGPVASVSRGDLHLLLSGPASSGSRPMPDGRKQEPGGWNRIVLYVDDLEAVVAALRKAGGRFRNEIEVGPGGKQIQIEDPDGNPIELHEAPKAVK
jgi:catechol 2,3-dioxygenase-like lactoylglutathione lyase family enzyme